MLVIYENLLVSRFLENPNIYSVRFSSEYAKPIIEITASVRNNETQQKSRQHQTVGS